MKKKKRKIIPVSVVIPTLGCDHLKKCIYKISVSSCLPKEVLILVPEDSYNKVKNYSINYKNLKIRVLLSKKKIKYYKELKVLKFKKDIVVQMDDDILLKKDCLIKLFNQISHIMKM